MEEATEKCDKMMKTLLTLLQYASLQSQRTPPHLNFPIVAQPDRAALMENIAAISPNPGHRMVSLSKAEELRKKKKELNQKKNVGIKAFEAELKKKKKQLHKAVDIRAIDGRREMKTKAMYAEEKFRQGKNHPQAHAVERGERREGGGREKRRSREMESMKGHMEVSMEGDG